MFGSVNRGSGPGRNRGNMPKPKDKPFAIPKPMVREAYRRVAANKGAPGVDEVTLGEFEADLENNLYRIWNRMSSGSYFPPPVRAVEIPKPHGGGVRVLGRAHDRRQDRPDRGGHVPGAVGGAQVPPGLPMATGRGRRRWMRSRHAGGGAGSSTGSSTSMSRSSSTPSGGTSWSR